MTEPAVAIVTEALRRFASRDVDGLLELFAEDGTFVDPHYPPPIGPAITGREAIRAALGWVFNLVERPGFTVRHGFSSDEPGVASVEVDTRHVVAGGAVLEFPQVFVGEVGPDGLIRRLQSYLPYPPPTG